MRIDLEAGKYTVGFDGSGQLFFERHHEPWPAADDYRHSEFIYLLVREVGRLRELEHQIQLAQLRTAEGTWEPRGELKPD